MTTLTFGLRPVPAFRNARPVFGFHYQFWNRDKAHIGAQKRSEKSYLYVVGSFTSM